MSSDSDEEDFVSYGTPLELLEEDSVPKKRALTVEDQVAKDKYGRRRFHGAFTGGFSAGFFNTVGSLEGWKPAQFKSSRSTKSEIESQRAEDFMDDEDMDEFGIAPKMLRPTSNYNQSGDSLSARKRPLKQFADGPIPGVPALMTLEPVKETIGIKLLMKMGWRPGQGVGPRLSKTEKKAVRKSRKRVVVYGCSLPTQQELPSKEQISSEGSDEDNLSLDVTFAPDDFQPYLVKPKNDVFGLGYSGLDRRPVLSSASHMDLFGPVGPSLVMQDKKKKVSIRGQAFGVGAFEEDDDDIYAKEDMSQYDFALDTPRMLSEKRQLERNSRLALPSSSSDVLEGFTLSSKPVLRQHYAPPHLPQGFTPRPPHLARPSRFSVSDTPQPTARASRLTAEERAVIVNENVSVMPTALQQKVTETLEAEVERTTGTFRPFVIDPDKQERYEKYLTLSKLGQTDRLGQLQPLTMTEWERERERSEFEQAARLYQPLSAAFSNRFTSASQPDDATDMLKPVERTAQGDEAVTNAAKNKMFGKLTRRIGEWLPHSILCKRFNIPQPNSSISSSQSKSQRPKFSVFNFLDAAPFNSAVSGQESLLQEKPKNDKTELESDVPMLSSKVPAKLLPTEEVEMEKENAETKDEKMDKLVESTSKIDLYKAIFLSSSDDESENDEKTTSTNREPTSDATKVAELNVLRNTSPPRGIFANLDLDSLNSREKKKSTQDGDALKKLPQTTTLELSRGSPSNGIFANLSQDSFSKSGCNQMTKTTEKVNVVPMQETIDKNMYGPSLPIVVPTTQQLNFENTQRKVSSDSDDNWVEQDESESSDDERKSSKHPSKKKKHKKPHKKSKKRKHKKQKHKKKK